MAVLDFLFEGTPPKAVTTYGQTVENMPKWYSDYTQGLVARANAIAAEPYQTYQGPRIAGFSPDQIQSQQSVRNNQGSWQPYTNAATGYLNSAGQVNPLSWASPYLSTAGGYTSQGANANIQGAAQPYMSAASGTFPQHVDEYMDPYIGNVINRSTDLAMQNYNERIQPGLEGQFVRMGTYGSSAHQREANRAARDLTNTIQGNAQAALSQGYGQAGQLFNQDASRMGNLAQLSGNLANMRAQNQLSGGQQMGNLAQLTGQLGTNYANQQLQVGQGMGNLGQLLQQLGYRDAAGLEAVGAQQQGLGQRNLDLAYQDFTNQRDFPRTTVDWMSSVIRGLQPPKSTETTQQQAGSAGPSPLSQLATLGSVVKGWNEMNAGG